MMYLSYADDSGFRGACIVDGDDVVTAGLRARMLGISPGGQVLGLCVPAEMLAKMEPYRNKLLSIEDLRTLGFAPVNASTGEAA